MTVPRIFEITCMERQRSHHSRRHPRSIRENSASELSAQNSSSDSSGENSSSNQVSPSYSCEDVQDALNKVYLSYSEVEAGSLPSPAT